MGLGSIIALIGYIKDLIGLVVTGVKAFMDWLARRERDKKNTEIEQKADDLKKTNEVTDDQERLRLKAEKLCELEKLADPDSTCDARDH